MGFNRQDGKRAGATIATMAALMLLGGCMTHSPSGPAVSRDEWLTTSDADKVVSAMSAKGMMPATIDCRFDNTAPGQVAYRSKFTWKQAPANTRYHWEVGDPNYLASKDVASNRVGLRRVFAKTARDPATRQKVGCSIWASSS
ncbi:hypothetical protein LB534_07310 [Mesorhizobium sp. CA18]|uniref:hypothetical protein n=1 Tax=unclassified Mesorhizobium TaxID=325217 RepID=UPI001CC9BECA|nr:MULTISPECIES: hypothetical protein [unclassified Mesorhizobium]MBZ9734170.1 hypothetical protein [Mesorhizobium sp. CA9]MBZ9825089.1 hypothetical protein [Mesorhizobium sp. CA18]MBZ9832132.1 hypothetical protein [Mesorhizobium sp. CA2]MBZ9836718.1 hypothetical protein [Mesorhizobium sp. CA3]MBZ9878338.1 hypothetical protein [Mesorhizobium sp. Ca11]